MQKIQIFTLTLSCTKNSYCDLKVMQKSSDFHANQSNLLMGVVAVYFYSKRFRFAPSFNNMNCDRSRVSIYIIYDNYYVPYVQE